MYEREHAHVFNYAHCMVGAIKASPIVHDMNDPRQILKIVFMYARHHTDQIYFIMYGGHHTQVGAKMGKSTRPVY